MGEGVSEGWGLCKNRALSGERKPAPPVRNLLEILKLGEIPMQSPGPQTHPHSLERLRVTTL